MIMRQAIIAGLLTLAATAALLGVSQFVVDDTASANQCASACYAAHNQCRVASKGSPSCDAQLSRCLAGCGRK
jgi:hypothetical protein